MTKFSRLFVVVALLAPTAGVAYAQQYPVMNMVANKVIEKYQNSTCEQVWENRGKQTA